MARTKAVAAPEVKTKAVAGGMVTKTIKMPLMVTMTGSKEALASDGEALIEKLKGELPLTMRLGRGRKEVITIAAK